MLDRTRYQDLKLQDLRFCVRSDRILCFKIGSRLIELGVTEFDVTG